LARVEWYEAGMGLICAFGLGSRVYVENPTDIFVVDALLGTYKHE
jgi:hypothetical protein